MSDEFKPPKSHRVAGPFLKKITLEMSDGQEIEFDVDGGSVGIENGITHISGGPSPFVDCRPNENQRIIIDAFKGNPDFLDEEITPMGTRLFNRGDR